MASHLDVNVGRRRPLVDIVVALVAAVSPALSGCPGGDESANCGIRAPAANLVTFLDDGYVLGTVDPSGGDGVLPGSSDAGFDWAVVAADKGVLVGKPAQDAIFRYTSEGLVGGGLSSGQVSGPLALERFGAAIGRRGGLTLIGAPDASPDPSRAEAGAVYLSVDLQAPAARIDGDKAEDHFGSVVVGCGDLDGDGVDDWAAASPWAADLAGSVTVGPTSPIADAEATSFLTLTGPEPTAGFGRALACANVGGNADEDLVVGAPFADRSGFGPGAGGVYLFTQLSDRTTPTVTLNPPGTDASFGAALAIGNFDGDGVPDLAVGAPGAFDGAGAVYLYFDEVLSPTAINVGEVGRELRSGVPSARFGTSVSAADVDGDGVDELLIGAPSVDPTRSGTTTIQAGALYVFDGDIFVPGGTAAAWPSVTYTSSAATTYLKEEACLRTGERLAAPDLDDDGRDDLVLLERSVTN